MTGLQYGYSSNKGLVGRARRDPWQGSEGPPRAANLKAYASLTIRSTDYHLKEGEERDADRVIREGTMFGRQPRWEQRRSVRMRGIVAQVGSNQVKL